MTRYADRKTAMKALGWNFTWSYEDLYLVQQHLVDSVVAEIEKARSGVGWTSAEREYARKCVNVLHNAIDALPDKNREAARCALDDLAFGLGFQP